MKVLLDYGHGYDTPGKRCKDLEEWKFNRNVGIFLELDLHHRRIPYEVLVHEAYDISLEERCDRAENIDHDILISIHGNYFHLTNVSGLETFYYSQSGKALAEILQNNLVRELGWNDRGIKKANFHILKYSPKTAVLSENGFYSNDMERAKMLDPEWQFRIALAHANAIEQYYG